MSGSDGHLTPATPQGAGWKKWPWIVLAVVVVVAALFVVINVTAGNTVKKVNKDVDKEVLVTYEVTGHGQASILYDTSTDKGMSSETAHDVPLPWSKNVSLSGSLRTPELVATLGANGGTITCAVKSAGRVLKTVTGTGPFASVTCEAALPSK